MGPSVKLLAPPPREKGEWGFAPSLRISDIKRRAPRSKAPPGVLLDTVRGPIIAPWRSRREGRRPTITVTGSPSTRPAYAPCRAPGAHAFRCAAPSRRRAREPAAPAGARCVRRVSDRSPRTGVRRAVLDGGPRRSSQGYAQAHQGLQAGLGVLRWTRLASSREWPAAALAVMRPVAITHVDASRLARRAR